MKAYFLSSAGQVLLEHGPDIRFAVDGIRTCFEFLVNID